MSEHQHHSMSEGVLHAASAAGDLMRDALLSIVTEPAHEHWEETLAEYNRRHRISGVAPGGPADRANPVG